MNCRHAEHLLSSQQDGQITAIEDAALSAHLQVCAGCRSRQSLFQSIGSTIREEAAPAIPPGLFQEAAARYRSEEKLRSRRFAFPEMKVLQPVALCAVVLAVGAAFWYARTGVKQNIRPGGQAPQQVALIIPIHQKNTVKQLPSKQAGQRQIDGQGGNNPLRESGVQKAPSPLQSAIIIHREKNSVKPGDLAVINFDPRMALSQWSRLRPDQVAMMEARIKGSVKGGDDFVSVPFPRMASLDDKGTKAAIETYQHEKEIVDARLQRKVHLASKGMAFTDLCALLSEQTGIEITANRRVADDKITAFCEDLPIRDLMRQVSRVFGFTWGRVGQENAYRYELVQDLRSQLLEEELRNRDRNEAMLALDREMQRFQKYLGLSPEEARERAKTASPEEKGLLDTLGGGGWGAAHMYFGLSNDESSALRNGSQLSFGGQEGGQSPLPDNVSKGVLHSLPNMRVRLDAKGNVESLGSIKDGISVADAPGVSTRIDLKLDESELGKLELNGTAHLDIGGGSNKASLGQGGAIAVGESPSVKDPKNADANAKLAKDPALQPVVTVEPKPSGNLETAPNQPNGGPRATTADVLEALYKASRMPIIADYYTRIYAPGNVTVKEATLFKALNGLSDTMRFRWSKQDGWLEFRTTGFFNERRKEVPNRFLDRWSASRKQNGNLTANDIVEISQLSDVQLNSSSMEEGAIACYGLKEWSIASTLRKHWRFLAGLTPGFRKEALSARGITFEQMPLPLQQQYIVLTFGDRANETGVTLDDLRGSTFQAKYNPTAAPAPQAEDGMLVPAGFIYHYGSERSGRMVMKIGLHGMSHGTDSSAR
jgi:hypothetical protein